jgi:hypothetical protein
MPIKPRVIETKKILASPDSLSAILAVAVDPVQSLNPQPPPSNGDSFYIVSYLEGKGYKFTVLFHLMVLHAIPRYDIPAPAALLGVSVLDEAVTPPVYYPFTEIADMGLAKTNVSPGLDIRIIDGEVSATLSGTIDALKITANLPAPTPAPTPPAGSSPLVLDLEMKAFGPIFNYLGAGIIPFSQGIDYEYALPCMTTTGTLTLKGRGYDVKGTSWLDREWGDFAPAQWTWMSIQLCNGVQIAVWNQLRLSSSTRYVGDQAFATILHCNDDVSVTPVTIVETSVETSLNGAGTYPNSWKVTISDRAELTVKTLVDGQQIKSNLVPRMEAKCSVEGTYEGHDVDIEGSRAFVEVAKIQLPPPALTATLTPAPTPAAPTAASTLAPTPAAATAAKSSASTV